MQRVYKTVEQLKEKTISWVIGGAMLTAMTMGDLSYSHESERTKTIPLGFSEKRQIEKDVIYSRREVDPYTTYLTSLNDFSMKIFEAWNNAWIPKEEPGSERLDDPYRRFSANLEYKYYHDGDFYYTLEDLARALPKQAEGVLQSMESFAEVETKLEEINNHFERAWTERHLDNYRTEIYMDMETSTDINGNLTTTPVTRTRQVYDDTDHYYTYHQEEGEAASRLLEDLIEEYRELTLNISLISTSKTNSEGEMAAFESRVKSPSKEKDFDPDQYLTIANTWKVGSVIYENSETFLHPWTVLERNLEQWNVAKKTAHNVHYRTFSHHHSGPEEYKVTVQTLNEGERIEGSINAVVTSVYYSLDNVPIIDQKIQELVDLREDGGLKEESEELIKETIQLYQSSFNRGFDVDRFRKGRVVLWSILGTIAGGLAGFGIKQGIIPSRKII